MTLLQIGPAPVGAESRVPPGAPLRVLFVCMPWASLDMPSLALSTLTPLVREHRGVESVDVLYGNLRWADHVLRESGGSVGEEDFGRIVRGDFIGVGEWVFSSALRSAQSPLPAPETTPFHRLASARGAELEGPSRMYRMAPGFVRALAEEIAGQEYDVVGLTTTFDQNIPSLALAGALKDLRPELVTVLGGANCDGPQGGALHEAYDFLDHVVRGEAELVLPQLLDVLSQEAAGLGEGERAARLGAISGLCWRTADGAPRANALAAGMVPMERVPTPDFSAYFDAFGRTESVRDTVPKVQIEGGRGCWWGEKHHCTFCGLNGTLMAFRSKPAERVLTEIRQVVTDHRVLDVIFSDNIIDMQYLTSLLPQVGELGWDLRMFFEVKSNLTYRQLLKMADGGVTQIQPGIENLSTRVLGLMRKGVTGWQNVRLLRDCRTLAIYPSWNVLYGFPGETWEDYASIVEQTRHLAHLFPPDLSTRIRLTRFSPYFTTPELGLENSGPSELLASVYQLPRERLADMVYMFDSEPAGLGAEHGARLERAVEQWQEAHRGARLVAFEEGSDLRIVDERVRRAPREHLLAAGLAVEAYRDLLKGRTAEVLARRMQESGLQDAARRLPALLDRWEGDGLVYRDGEHLVALATGLEWS
ncbi:MULTISPECIES: RiPP maturation radical SAM C-methyltransferase [unclassified Streptomyces]|uniref:RiPP maturation radical SAM C-methyltransferase n=1 Tax=unclassified Streptomyces TaxID=2593676 RepID=UPI002E284A71|nr:MULTISPECIES: RiPP maturation radical SAM C-methyltransferase [unclassified Streptomyces]